MKHLLIFMTTAIAFSSCYNKTSCGNQSTYMLMFYPANSAAKIEDTMATLISYTRGSNFETVADTFETQMGGSPTNPQPLYFSELTTPLCYNYDWIITLHPSGKLFRLKDIEHHQRSVKNLNSYYCSNDITYTVNDSSYLLKGQEGQPSSVAYMSVRY